jgi:hypothetical protein
VATPLATGGHDRTAGPGTHAQPEPVRPRPAAVVRLEGALALAHGRISRLLQAWWPRWLGWLPRPRAAVAACSSGSHSLHEGKRASDDTSRWAVHRAGLPEIKRSSVPASERGLYEGTQCSVAAQNRGR